MNFVSAQKVNIESLSVVFSSTCSRVALLHLMTHEIFFAQSQRNEVRELRQVFYFAL